MIYDEYEFDYFNNDDLLVLLKLRECNTDFNVIDTLLGKIPGSSFIKYNQIFKD